MKCISPVYVRKQQMYVPCGKCAFCLKKRIDGWVFRLREEMHVSSSAFFLTLTYEDKNLPSDGHLCKRDLQLFLKRLRKVNPGIRYYGIGEYGSEFGRPHYHVLLFNLIALQLVTDNWKLGFIQGSRLTVGRIRYTVSYCLGAQSQTDRVKPFAIMSRNPGIGFSYVTKMGKFHRARSDSVVFDFDCANAMPRYYLDKIYSTPGQRRYIQMQRMRFSQTHNTPTPSADQHEALLRKLNRKNL